MTLSIYLAGNIQKSHDTTKQLFWTKREEELLKEQLDPLQLTFLNPAIRTDDLSDQKSVFGRDMAMVYCSDLVIVDARERRGLGVGAEMLFAKTHHIPIISWVGAEGHYYKKEIELLGVKVDRWTHPFIESLSDLIVSDLAEATSWIQNLSSHTIKGPGSIEEAMHYYMHKQFKGDLPMQQLAQKNTPLKERLEAISEDALEIR